MRLLEIKPKDESIKITEALDAVMEKARRGEVGSLIVVMASGGAVEMICADGNRKTNACERIGMLCIARAFIENEEM